MSLVRTARAWRRVLLGLLAVGALLVLTPPTAQAHSGLVSSDPAQQVVLQETPDRATLTFNENVTPVAASFQLYDPAGKKQQVSAAAVDRVVNVTLPTGLMEGSYVLSWRVISADSHPIAGALLFSVGHTSGQTAVWGDLQQTVDERVAVVYLVAQIAAYLGLLAAVGLTFFEVAVLRSAPGVNHARKRLLVGAASATIVGHAALLPLTLLRGQGLSLDRLLDSTLLLSTLRSAPALALALVVLGCSAMLLRPVLSRWLRTVLPVLGAMLAVASVLPVGHTRTALPTALVMVADLVHTLAGAFWFGGVIGLGMLLRAAKRDGTPAGEAADAVRRFSGPAVLIVAALGVTGLALGVLILGSVSALVETSYGRTLLVKLAFVAVIGVLALWNATYLVPAVARPRAPQQQWRSLTGAVRDEVALLVAAICITAMLVMQSPASTEVPPNPAPAALGFRSALGEGRVQGSITPARVGANEFEFTVRGADGAPVSPLETPKVTATLPDEGLGPLLVSVRRTDVPGRYRAAMTLPTRGQWQISIVVRVDRFAKLTAQQAVAVGE